MIVQSRRPPVDGSRIWPTPWGMLLSLLAGGQPRRARAVRAARRLGLRPAGRLLAQPPPGGDRHIGTIQPLGRNAHQLDHPLVLAVLLAVEDPAHPEPVPEPELQRLQPAGALGGEQAGEVMVLVPGNVQLVARPALLPIQQGTGQADADAGGAAAPPLPGMAAGPAPQARVGYVPDGVVADAHQPLAVLAR